MLQEALVSLENDQYAPEKLTGLQFQTAGRLDTYNCDSTLLQVGLLLVEIPPVIWRFCTDRE